LAFEDKNLTCRDCGATFIFTAGEQGFYLERGLLNEPQRCLSCRANRRRVRGDAAPGAARAMTPVACSECGAQTAVPFVPRLDRPVYCNDCFSRVRAGAAR
jgi:CxxC-x17-CxxC domain-containing protein